MSARLAAGLLPILLTLGGCASDYVPAERPGVPPEIYQANLDSCQSYAAAARAGNGAEGFLIGALWGAANGAAAGAHHGGAGIGAAIGAGVGAVIGLAEGLSWPDASSCMRAKGYRRA